MWVTSNYVWFYKMFCKYRLMKKMKIRYRTHDNRKELWLYIKIFVHCVKMQKFELKNGFVCIIIFESLCQNLKRLHVHSYYHNNCNSAMIFFLFSLITLKNCSNIFFSFLLFFLRVWMFLHCLLRDSWFSSASDQWCTFVTSMLLQLVMHKKLLPFHRWFLSWMCL